MPWLVVVPIDGRGADGGRLLELVGKPFGAIGFGPPMGIWDAAIVAVSRKKSVVDGAQ